MNFKEWYYIAEALKPAEIIAADIGKDNLKKLQDIIPAGLRDDEKNKYLLTAYHFSKQQNNFATLKNDLELYKRLISFNQMKLFSFDNNGKLNPQFKEFESYIDWTEKMHGILEDMKKKEEMTEASVVNEEVLDQAEPIDEVAVAQVEEGVDQAESLRAVASEWLASVLQTVPKNK